MSAATIVKRAYGDGGRMTGSSYGNGVSDTRSYNTRAENTLASISFSGAAIGTYSYRWDDNKNKTSETITGTMSGYGFTVGTSGYDTEDRLINWERSDTNLDQSWDLSLVGDWDSVTENSSTQNRTHGPTHELLTASGQSLSHDTKGNMTLIPALLRDGTNSLTLNWDFENKLTTADVGSDSTIDVTYKWDALGRRVYRDDGTSPRVFVQVGQQTIADYGAGMAASSPKYRYVYASYIDEPVLRYEPSGSETLYCHRNQQFSIIALTDGSGAIAERYAYSAYGEPVFANASGAVLTSSVVDNRCTYTGREWDEGLKLYHFRARMYDAESGRFLGRDPIRFASLPFSTFQFLASNVLTSTDPWGLLPIHDDPSGQLGYQSPSDGSDENNNGNQVLGLDVLIWVLEQGCLAQCYLLGWNDDEIKQLLEGLVEDAPQEIKDLFWQWVGNQPSKALLGLLQIIKNGVYDIKVIQGLNLPGRLLRWILGSFQIHIRRALAETSLRLVGKGGQRILTKLGTKAIPIIGWALLAKEGCDLGFCNWACKDGRYDETDTCEEFNKDGDVEAEKIRKH